MFQWIKALFGLEYLPKLKKANLRLIRDAEFYRFFLKLPLTKTKN